jgi:hypothetical protein
METDLKVHDEAKVITKPDALDWPVEGETGSLDLCARLGMGLPTADENSCWQTMLKGIEQARQPRWCTF